MQLSTFVSLSVVKLEGLDAASNTLSWSTGFFVEERDFMSLYTCWHVVTGTDPFEMKPQRPPRRAKLRVHFVGVTNEMPGVKHLGGPSHFEVELFDAKGKANWIQSSPQDGVEGAEIPLPQWDCVRINVEEYRSILPGFLRATDQSNSFLEVTKEVFIVGFPFGYSASESEPIPVFLKRAPASAGWSRRFQLLDGPGARGMSGGPILILEQGRWRFVGIYNGVVFPESALRLEKLGDPEAGSALPLGKFTDAYVARLALGAIDITSPQSKSPASPHGSPR